MTSDEYVIEAEGLRRIYAGGFEAVTGISFSVARGEIFALLGTNGAGKTSTVELLEGLAAPDDGRVRVLGHDPRRERAALRPRIGVMLQEGARMRVRDDLSASVWRRRSRRPRRSWRRSGSPSGRSSSP